MDLAKYRGTPAEIERVARLLALVPAGQATALDVGARDGYLSLRLAELCASVTALDLQAPRVAHERVACVTGDVTALQFPAASFDVVFCAEVLEHLDPAQLPTACAELARVARTFVIVGVPYRQDTRVSRTTCRACGSRNPAWGHRNRFDADRLEQLFPTCTVERVELVGTSPGRTNAVSSWLMDLAGNPYGTYDQDEPCLSCGARLEPPPRATLMERVFARAAVLLERLQRRVTPSQANWIHVRLARHR